jgi:hypothetical protein
MEVAGYSVSLKSVLLLPTFPSRGERSASIEERGPFILFLADRARCHALPEHQLDHSSPGREQGSEIPEGRGTALPSGNARAK